jgi:NAD(P)-dependent dehydrogenase (short-subunit alcohol dehydrogenase family)
MARESLEKLFSLEGKVALITGGYRGIGLAIAEAYAEAGANLAIVARNLEGCRSAAENLRDAFAIKTVGKAMDVRDSKAVDRVIQETADEFGSLDIVVNSAGISGSEKHVVDMTDEEIDEVINVDFRGTFMVSRAAARIMVKQKSGHIINVASVYGKIAASNISGYCASKAAVLQLTRVMALELRRDNIQVNAICPGYFLTDLNKTFFESEAGKALIRKMIPLNRVGRLDELKSLAVYLAACPPFMTGSDVYIDGGHTIV